MKIMLTGASGYLGHAIALKAAGDGHIVHALLRSPQGPSVPRHPNINFFKGDLADIESIKAAMDGCDAVIHSAAIAKMWTRDRQLMYKVNVEGTRNMLQAAVDCNIQKLVFTSSCSVLGPSSGVPVNETTPRINSMTTDYEISKHLAEELCRRYARNGLHTVIVSPPAIYGPGSPTASNAISNMIRQSMRSGILFQPSPSSLCRNFAYIEDVARGHLLALQHGRSGETYILGGENISFKTFSHTIRNASATRMTIISMPAILLKTAAQLNHLKLKVTRTESNFVPSTVRQLFQQRVFSSEKAQIQLGYSITPFETGIQESINQLKLQL